MSFKDGLKKILPPPVNSFNREIARVLETIEHEGMRLENTIKEVTNNLSKQEESQQEAINIYCKLLQDLTKKIEEQDVVIKRQEDLLNQQGKALEDQKKRLTQVQDSIMEIPNKTVFWKNEYERNVVRLNWGDVTEAPDFAEKFTKLTSGLSPENIEKIVRILKRQKQYLNTDQKRLDLFTRGEQEELRLLNENFYSEIIKLSNDLYAYKNYLLPINHFESSVFYYKHGIHQLKTSDQVKGKVIIDVGGYIGDSVLVLSELNPSTIYTFEAVPENYELLKKTMQLNHISNYVAERVALGAETGTQIMHVCGSGSSSTEREGITFREDVQVPVITLDEYVQQHEIKNIGLIKVDIEGSEPEFLKGAKKTICEQKPILLLSIYHNAHDFFELKPLLESWNLGYRFDIHKPVFENATAETLLIAEVPQ